MDWQRVLLALPGIAPHLRGDDWCLYLFLRTRFYIRNKAIILFIYIGYFNFPTNIDE